jgi:hypothetical protein
MGGGMTLQTITPREASIFACVADTAIAPEPVLPPVRDTDAALFFDDWMTLSPRLFESGMRTLMYAIELAPLALGYGHRLRRLSVEQRAEVLRRLERSSVIQVRQIATLVKSMAFLAYYGDDAVLLRCGYDADANLRRGRELRAAEGRP